jgi:hypothetical protein
MDDDLFVTLGAEPLLRVLIQELPDKIYGIIIKHRVVEIRVHLLDRQIDSLIAVGLLNLREVAPVPRALCAERTDAI